MNTRFLWIASIVFALFFSFIGLPLSSGLVIPGTLALAAQDGPIGEVAGIDESSGQITIKTDAGATVTVTADEKTSILRLPPGETTLDKAVKITLADLAVGDRVYARERVAGQQPSVARSIIVMKRSDIAQKQQQEREEWRRRGIVGTISTLDPAKKEIALQVRTPEGPKPVVIEATGNVLYKRYAPNSVRFSDAKRSSFNELQVGDQIRALGEKNADETRFKPEQIVSGAFRTVMGTVTNVDAESQRLTVTDLETQQSLTVLISKDSMLRRIQPMMAQMMAQRAQGQSAAAVPAAQQGDRAQGRPQGDAAAGQRMAGGPGARGDIMEMLERLPAMPVADIKTGEMVAFLTTRTSNPSEATAITLIAGLEAFGNMGARPGGPASGPSLQPGLLDFNIGLP